MFPREVGYYVALYAFSIYIEFLNALLMVMGVVDGDGIFSASYDATYGVFAQVRRNTGVDTQPVQLGLNTEYILRDGQPVPRGCPCQP